MALALTALKATKVLEGLLRPAPPEEKISDFRFEHWYQDGWCWAAATTMVHEMLSHVHLDQCQWAVELISPTCCTDRAGCNQGRPIKDALDLRGHCRNVDKGGFEFDVVQQEVAARRPIACAVGGAHCVVIFGWKIDPQVGNCIWYADPAQQGEDWYPHSTKAIRKLSWDASYRTK